MLRGLGILSNDAQQTIGWKPIPLAWRHGPKAKGFKGLTINGSSLEPLAKQ